MNKFNDINAKIGKYRWTICSLLFFATTINYLDRQVLSLLQPSLSEEYGWTNSDYANITAAFQFCYAIAVIFAGRFIDWIGTRKGYVWAIAVWSFAATIHAFAIGIGEVVSPVLSIIGIVLPVSVLGFIVGRIVLAIGEAGNFPAAVKTVAEWFPRNERSLATGIFNSGANIGAILAPLTIPWVAEYWGWQSAFVIVGCIGFLWIIFWILFYDSPQKMLAKGKINQAEYDYINEEKENIISQKSNTKEKVSWFKLLSYRQTWSFFFGKFMTDGVWWFFLFWLPAYLESQYNMKNTQITLPLTVLYSMTMAGSICGGWFPAYFIKKGFEPYRARMTAMLVIAIIPLMILLAQPLGYISMWIPVILIGIGCSAHQAWSANIYTTVSDMFPTKAVASIIGIGTMAGGISGVIISKTAGTLFDYYKTIGHIETGYTIVFSFCAVAYLLAWIIMKSLVPKFKPVVL
ncbi:MAG: MFS transporter [Dysgonamonadaceae bacterium]|jgi:ACS family hexuronate transporter-like MFS transporter|nr:MFS transporter [Dysgonamonadaceae bacterium]